MNSYDFEITIKAAVTAAKQAETKVSNVSEKLDALVFDDHWILIKDKTLKPKLTPHKLRVKKALQVIRKITATLETFLDEIDFDELDISLEEGRTRPCRTCKRVFPETEDYFYRNKNTYNLDCKACKAKYTNERRKALRKFRREGTPWRGF